MMKSFTQIAFVCAVGACLCVETSHAGHFTVPQSSASDYIFSIPSHPAHIRGIVIDPTNRYGVIRSEDVDWIWEAYCERLALLNGAMPVPAVHVSTSQVMRADVRIPAWGGAWGWLDPDAPLIGEYPVKLQAHPVRTNVWSYSKGITGSSNAFSTITMPMTNGTMSVFTNSWSAYMATNRVMVSVTNLIGYNVLGADLLPLPSYTTAPYNNWGAFDSAMSHMPSASAFATAYSILRGCKRLGEMCSFTNTAWHVSESESDGIPSAPITNRWSYGYYYYQSFSNLSTRAETLTSPGYAPTRFSSELIVTGGVQRVQVEAAYAIFWYMYDYTRGDEYYSTTNATCAMKISGGSLDLSGEKAVYTATINPYDLALAGSFVTASEPPPYALGTHVGGGEEKLWLAVLEYIMIIYSITPSTMLPGW